MTAIYLEPTCAIKAEFFPLQRISEELSKDYGINFTDSPNNADIYITHGKMGFNHINNIDHDTICVFGLNDSCTEVEADIIVLDKVKIYQETTAPDKLDKRKIGYVRYHSYLLDPERYNNITPVLTDDIYSKCRLANSAAHFHFMIPWIEREPNISKKRKITAFFEGAGDFGGEFLITEHRKKFAKLIEPFDNRNSKSGRISRDVFHYMSLDTNIMLSPWGYGEVCFRDVEAMYAGLVLLKPNSDHVITNPQLFKDGFTYIACDIHGRDLGEKIQYIMDEWNNLEEMRYRNRQMLIDSWDKNYMAKIYSDVFKLGN